MRAREIERVAKRIVRDQLPRHDFELKVMSSWSKGNKGDKAHYGRVVELDLKMKLTIDAHYAVLDRLASRLMNEIEDVNRVTWVVR